MSADVVARASVRVPATTANLGSGFDCVGVAINKWLSVSARVVLGAAGGAPVVHCERSGTLRALDGTLGEVSGQRGGVGVQAGGVGVQAGEVGGQAGEVGGQAGEVGVQGGGVGGQRGGVGGQAGGVGGQRGEVGVRGGGVAGQRGGVGVQRGGVGVQGRGVGVHGGGVGVQSGGVGVQGGEVGVQGCGVTWRGGEAPYPDLICRGFFAAIRATGREASVRSVHFRAHSEIPIARGLGSSAAALLAGAALANSALGLALSVNELAKLCAQMEGHGDNAGAAAFGGAVLAMPNAECTSFAALPVHESLGFAFAVPLFETKTELARAALPSHVEFSTAVSAAARSAALVRGLQTADLALLTAGLDDVLHVPHRKALVPHYDLIVRAARVAGAFGATLSGSGSSIVAIGPREVMARVAAVMVSVWRDSGIEAHGFTTGVCATGLTVVPPAYQPTSIPAYPSLPRSITCP